MKHWFLAAFLLLAGATEAQKTTWKGLSLLEENDFLNILPRGLDRYYSQGVRFDLHYLHSNPRHLRALHPTVGAQSVMTYQWSLTQQLFTPSHTQSPFFQFSTDRPYASVAFFSHGATSTDTVRQVQLTTRLDLGIIGPWALGQEVQTLFHTLTQEPIPQGWGNQMQNDIYLNYYLEYVRLLHPFRHIKVSAVTQVNAGTVFNTTAFGLALQTPTRSLRKAFDYSFFLRPSARLVFYNSLLQGGVLAHVEKAHPQYFLGNKDLVVGQLQAGWTLRRKKRTFTYTTTFLTKEFRSGLTHFYSGVTLGFDF